MRFDPSGTAPDEGGLYQHMLPAEPCSSCRGTISRREHRVYVRPTWHGSRDVLCGGCWNIIVSWAQRFALRQSEFLLDN